VREGGRKGGREGGREGDLALRFVRYKIVPHDISLILACRRQSGASHVFAGRQRHPVCAYNFCVHLCIYIYNMHVCTHVYAYYIVRIYMENACWCIYIYR